MIYLAAPYTKVKDKEKVFQIVNRIAAALFDEGKEVFSPISHSHFIHKLTKRSIDWVCFDYKMLAICDTIEVICIDGYKESEGLRRELRRSVKAGKKVIYVDEQGVRL